MKHSSIETATRRPRHPHEPQRLAGTRPPLATARRLPPQTERSDPTMQTYYDTYKHTDITAHLVEVCGLSDSDRRKLWLYFARQSLSIHAEIMKLMAFFTKRENDLPSNIVTVLGAERLLIYLQLVAILLHQNMPKSVRRYTALKREYRPTQKLEDEYKPPQKKDTLFYKLRKLKGEIQGYRDSGLSWAKIAPLLKRRHRSMFAKYKSLDPDHVGKVWKEVIGQS